MNNSVDYISDKVTDVANTWYIVYICNQSVLVLFPVVVIKHLDKKNLEEISVYFAHKSRLQAIILKKLRQQELD